MPTSCAVAWNDEIQESLRNFKAACVANEFSNRLSYGRGQKDIQSLDL